MKKIYIPFIAFIALFNSIGCSNSQEKDIFEKSSIVRVDEAIAHYKALLLSSEHGWIFENYPGGSTQEHGGFVYTLQFTENQVTAMLDINRERKVTTSYDIIPYGGAMLSFNENNSLIHAFTEPSTNLVDGLRGDFEFVFMSHTNDEIIVKGKKYGDDLRLIRLKEPAESYMNKLLTNENLIEGRGVQSLKIANTETNFSKAGRVISYENSAGEAVVIPFNYTDKGIHFYKAIDINGTKVQDLTYDGINSFKDEKGLFSLALLVPPPIDFANTRYAIRVDRANGVSEKFKEKFNEVKTQLATEIPNLPLELWEQLVMGTHLGGSATGTGLRFFSLVDKIKLTGFPTMFHADFYGDIDRPNLLYVKDKKSHMGQNLIPLAKFRDYFFENAPFLIEKQANNTIKLTSQKDASIWFVLEKLPTLGN